MAQPHGERPTTTTERVTRDTEVRHLLDDYTRALSRGDTVALSSLWEFPAVVLSDDRARVLSSRDEARALYSAAKARYQSQGISFSRPEPLFVHWVSDRMAVVEVRWPFRDASGAELGSETSTYTVRRGKSGRLKMQGALEHGVSRTQH